MYSGIIISKSERSRAASAGDSRTCSFVFNEGRSSVHAYSTHCNKMATCDFGPDTVISCERALFLLTAP